MVEDPRNGTMDEGRMVPPFCLFFFFLLIVRRLPRVIFSVGKNITQTWCCFFSPFYTFHSAFFLDFLLRFTPDNLPKKKSLAFLFP